MTFHLIKRDYNSFYSLNLNLLRFLQLKFMSEKKLNIKVIKTIKLKFLLFVIIKIGNKIDYNTNSFMILKKFI